MRFWDSSAILPLLVGESSSRSIEAIFREDPKQMVWCLTEVEVVSGLARRLREGLEASIHETARRTLRPLTESWQEVVSLEAVRSRAIRLLGTHPLGAADALQLAAALVLCDEQPQSLRLVCLDDRLREAARKEGFPVLPA